MQPALLAFAVGLAQGLLHGLGPDHCAAMATLGVSASASRRAALRNALTFAVGHMAVLGAVAVFCVGVGIGISEAFERWAEILGGAVLVSLALAALFLPSVLRHGHAHLPHHGATHAHPPHERSLRVSTAAGALMAVSGARSLFLALPPLVLGGTFRLHAWAYLPGFSLGILLSMGAFGLLVSAGSSRLGERWALTLQRGVALASGALGVWWIAVRL